MINVMFVCYGNICRSPMAEFLFKHRIEKLGLKDRFYVASSATSFEEIGNGVHRGTREILDRFSIDYSKKRAIHLEKSDYDKFDYVLVMDQNNLIEAKRIFGGDKKNKVKLLMDFTKNPRSVADPWYTRNFEVTYEDITEGISGFLQFLKNNGSI